MAGERPPGLQVIVLGSGGGPQEANTTAFLVRSVAQNWSRGSIVAVDGGVHLSAITRLIEEALPASPPPTPTPSSAPASRQVLTTGPFAGLELPSSTPAANAAYVARFLVDTYLITHPHLDHISAFVVNTAGLQDSRPKKLAALPSTIEALKTHIFNNVIWPNLSDENNGAGLLTYLRLVEGGSPALGDGYLEICDGLLVKTWSVSHGHCMEKHVHRGSVCNSLPARFGSHDMSSFMPRRDTYSHPYPHDIRRDTLSHLYPPALSRRPSTLPQPVLSLGGSPQFGPSEFEPHHCVYDSSAYFIRDQAYEREVLIFGDVEPDSISLSPRNLQIWQEAAPKIAAGTLAAIFIECSYDDSQPDERLFGHLKPFYLIEEMQVLANQVESARKARSLESNKKRKRGGADEGGPETHRKRAPATVTSILVIPTASMNMHDPGSAEDPVSPKSANPLHVPADYWSAKSEPEPESETPHLATPTGDLSLGELDAAGTPFPMSAGGGGAPPLSQSLAAPPAAASAAASAPTRRPLEGLRVVIIHVKETLQDGPPVGETILQQLKDYEQDAQLGCEFIVSKSGQSFYF